MIQREVADKMKIIKACNKNLFRAASNHIEKDNNKAFILCPGTTNVHRATEMDI